MCKKEFENANTKNIASVKSNDKAQDHKSSSERLRGIRIAVCAFLAALILGAGVFCVYVNAYSRVMPNTYVENMNLGGMTQEEAAAAVDAEYNSAKLDGATMTFHCMGDTSMIEVKNLSVCFDPDKTADDVYQVGRNERGFFHKLSAFFRGIFGRNIVRPSLSFDEEALTGAISDLCSPYETEPMGYTYRLGEGSSIVIAKPQQGVKVDMDAAVAQVVDRICSFTFGDLTFEPIVTEAEALDLDAFYNYITSPAIDASYAKDENNKVYVVGGKPQIVVSKEQVERAVKQPDLEYTLPVQLVEPAVNAEFLQSVLYEDTLGTYTTSYGGSSASRASNINRASATINGYELLPGERFDFNKIVGKRTAERGYLPAPVYVVREGETVSEIDYGGGICQVSSTIFCAVNRAGLKIIARTSHSKDVAYVPKGMDATVSWGGPEFIFENNKDYPVRIFVDAGGGTLTVRVVGSVVDSVPGGSMTVDNDGSNVTVTKTIKNPDGSEAQQVISSLTPPSSMPE